MNKIVLDAILFISSRYLNVSASDIKGKSRKSDAVTARHYILAYIANNSKKFELSLEQIGNYFNRDHSTVIHARDKINEQSELYFELKNKYKAFNSYVESKIDSRVYTTGVIVNNELDILQERLKLLQKRHLRILNLEYQTQNSMFNISKQINILQIKKEDI
jgi:hypothetical protein